MPSGSELVFYAFALLAVVSALITITRKNPVVAAVWLVASFFAVAACYVMLSATFLAAIQVLVYAGAIMVLFVFVIMVLDVDEAGVVEHKRPSRIGRIGYYGSVTLGVGFLFWVLAGTLARLFVTPGADLSAQPEFGSADAIGRSLFTDYLFAFEAISMLLLAAVIGAVVVARSRKERLKEAAHHHLSPEARLAAGLEHDREHDGDLAAPGPTPEFDFGLPSAGGHRGGVS
jgi:NADH-quinone oxidoreductase subunit J